METTDTLHRRIAAEYSARGDTLGWRFLYSPITTLDGADVAFIGLNPGGDHDEPNHPSFARPPGSSAYVDESWKGRAAGTEPLQRQVRLLFEKVGVAPHEVLAGNLVPFRSPNWTSLRNRQPALEFGYSIWRSVLEHVRPKLVIAMGTEAAAHVAVVLGVQLEAVRVGWGDLTATKGIGDDVTFVGLPHLSRFQLFGREASRAPLDYLLSDWRGS